jgi:hypothetical protein
MTDRERIAEVERCDRQNARNAIQILTIDEREMEDERSRQQRQCDWDDAMRRDKGPRRGDNLVH